MGAKLIAIGLLALAAFAQVRVTGRVTSDTFAPVANANVVFRAAGGQHFNAISDPGGAFTVEVPQTGDLLVDVERAGFFAIKNQKIAAGATDVQLVLNPVREFAESVDVAGALSSVALDQVTSPTRLDGANLMDVPYPTTHNLKAGMRILPGVVQDSAGGIHVNGGSENQVLYLLDGFNIGDPLTGTLQSRVSVEAVQSMDVMTGSFSPEYGKGSAGVLSVNTKMGDDRFRYSATNFIPGLTNSKGWRIGSWNPRLNFSGPIARGKAWFSDSLTGQYDQTVIRELPNGRDQSTSLRYSNLLRGQVNLSPTNILYLGFLANQLTAARTGLTPLDPVETTVDRRARQWFTDIKDQIYLPGRAVLEIGYANNRTFARQIPQGNDFYITSPDGHAGNFFVNGTQSAGRDQWLANAFLPALHWLGEHQLKTGVDFDRITYDQDLQRTGMLFYSGKLLARRVAYAGSGRLGQDNFESSAYVQDSWRVRPKVLVELGVRADRDEILRNWGVSPRLGAAWSPFQNDNTKISGGFAVTYDAANLQLFTRPLDQNPVITYYPPYGNASVVEQFLVLGRNYRMPRFTTLNLALDQRLTSSLYLKLQALRRRGSHGLNYATDNYAANNVVAGDTVYQLINGRADAYESFEITARQNLRKQYEWLASYTRSRATSNSVLDISADQPAIAASNFGRMPWDAPNRFVGWGYLPTFWENWAIAFLAEYRTGFPFSVQNGAGVIMGDVNSHRYPEFFELNFHIERRLRFHGQLWAVRAGCNNITNHQNPNAVINDIDSDRFLQFFGGQSRATVFRIRWLGKLN